MTLFSALRALPDLEVVGLNFSSAPSPELILKTFDHYCEYRKTSNGLVLAPTQGHQLKNFSQRPTFSFTSISNLISVFCLDLLALIQSSHRTNLAKIGLKFLSNPHRAQIGKWLVMFCDEINLPDMDAYGTQRVISFLRQLVEYNGFYRVTDQVSMYFSFNGISISGTPI